MTPAPAQPALAPPPRILILRLSPFRDVVHSSSHHFLADAARRAVAGVGIDFAFLPPDPPSPHAAAVAGVLTGKPLTAFDLVLVSNAFVLEAVNLPYLLHRCGLSPWASERPAGCPPVVLGGSNALASQCLVRPDGDAVPDAIFFGEGEGALETFLAAWMAGADCAKRERLERAAAATDGFWVTGSWPTRPVRQAVARALPPPPEPVILLDSEVADTVRLQASLGCPAFCSFCFEGYERKPYRERPAARLLDYARQLKVASGARTVELDAFNLNTHLELSALVSGLSRLFDHVAFKSQRVDILAEQPELTAVEVAAGKRSFTLGIEGISTRMRAFLGKSLTDEAIEKVIRDLLTARVRELKLFFILTGHESTADLAAFAAFARTVAGWAGGARRVTRVVFSFGRLVRMPNTPLRYDRLFLDPTAWQKLVDSAEASCRRANLEFRLATTWPEYLATQLLAAADEQAASIVVALAQEGFHFAGHLAASAADRLAQALSEAGILDDAFAAAKPPEHRFAFAFVETAVTSAFLQRQYHAAVAGRDRGYCLGAACQTCGACRNAQERTALTKRPRVPHVPRSIADEIAALVAAKQRLAPVLARVRLDASFAGGHPEWVSARLMQLLLTAWPEEVDNLLTVEECLFGAPANRERFPIPAGVTLVALKAWDPTRLRARVATGGPVGAVHVEPARPEDQPGTFRTADWSIRMACDEAMATSVLARWMMDTHLPHTLRRVAGVARFELAPAAQRKHVIYAAASTPVAADKTEVALTIGPKTDLRSLLGRLAEVAPVGAPHCDRWTTNIPR